MTEKLSYEAEAREIADEYSAGFSESWKREAAAAILALVDKARQAQAAECSRHLPLVNHGIALSCLRCYWKVKQNDACWAQWADHVAALGRK